MGIYYEVLGLKQGASQEEIKRAYFSLVRQYSPEKDPEKFREIREAYEHLKDAEEEQGPVFAEPRESWAKQFLKQIQIYQKNGDDLRVRDACEEAWRVFPDEIQFLYLLMKAQRWVGNTGKAVKSGEKLIEREPENKWFWRELAIAYQERGFTRKAFFAFDKAYELGCRDLDFVLDFSLSCNDYKQFSKGIQLLTELISREKRWKREEIPQALEAYSGLISMTIQSEQEPGNILEDFKDFLLRYKIYMEESQEELLRIMTVFMLHPSFADSKGRVVLKEILDILDSAFHSDEGKELLEELRGASVSWAYNDPRLNETMQNGAEVFQMVEGMEPEIRNFAIMDVKLRMIKERQEILPQLDIIESEYPAYFEKIQDFAEQLRYGKNLEYLKNSMMKQYIRLVQYIDGGMYFEKYPQEKERYMGRVVYQSEDDMPYVRSSKKIGRNDPCPCGSGKKYKHCCMRKNT